MRTYKNDSKNILIHYGNEDNDILVGGHGANDFNWGIGNDMIKGLTMDTNTSDYEYI